MITPSDFNMWAAGYYHTAVNIASRFAERTTDPGEWARLSCEWHIAFEFGYTAPASDVYFEVNFMRRHSVDEMVANPPNTLKGRELFKAWKSHAAALESRRRNPPPVFPEPQPEPKPEPKPAEPVEPEKPTEPAKPKTPSPIPGMIGAALRGLWGILLPVLLGFLKTFLLSKINKKGSK